MDNQNSATPTPMPQNPPASTPPASPQPDLVPEKPLSKNDKLKRVFLQVLVACLVVAAAIAVVAVLVGHFNSLLARAVSTIAVVAIHSLLSFSYIANAEKRDDKYGKTNTDFFSNAVFALIAVSFITAVFGIWQILSGHIALKLYMFYGVLLFATLHADVLYRLKDLEKRINNLVEANYIFMSIVVFMLTIMIFATSLSSLGHFFYRLLAATAIVDATLTLTAMIMQKMYLQKHPDLASRGGEQIKTFWHNPLVVLLLLLLGLQVIGGVVGLIAHGF